MSQVMCCLIITPHNYAKYIHIYIYIYICIIHLNWRRCSQLHVYTNTISNQHYEDDPLPYSLCRFNPTVAIRGHELKLLVEFYAWNSLPRSIKYFSTHRSSLYAQVLLENHRIWVWSKAMVSSKYAKCSQCNGFVATCYKLAIRSCRSHSALQSLTALYIPGACTINGGGCLDCTD